MRISDDAILIVSAIVDEPEQDDMTQEGSQITWMHFSARGIWPVVAQSLPVVESLTYDWVLYAVERQDARCLNRHIAGYGCDASGLGHPANRLQTRRIL